MFPNFGMGELLVILLIVLVLFGAKRLPETARGLGKSIKAFRDGVRDTTDTHSEDSEEKKIP